MSKMQEILEIAVELWGIDDIVTKMICKRRNEELVKIQKEIYEKYKKEHKYVI